VIDLAAYDAVVLVSAVYMGRWMKPARRFAEHNATALAARPVWLFSRGPLGPADRLAPEGEPADTAELMKLTGARNHRVFAGRLERDRLGLAEKAATRAVHAPKATAATGKRSTRSPARSPHSFQPQIGHTTQHFTFSVYEQVHRRRYVDEQAIWELMRFADEPAERATSRQATRSVGS